MIGISLGSWAFHTGPFANEPLPLERVLTRLAALDYDGVEISGAAPHFPLHDASPSRRTGLRRKLEEYGLGISGYFADLSAINPATDGAKPAYLDLFTRNVELCADIGSPTIRVDAGAAQGTLSEWDYHRAGERLAGVWTEAANIAALHRVALAWEFTPAFIYNKPTEVAALHRRVDHPNFHVLFSTAHAYMSSVAGARQHGARETLTGGVPEFLKKLEDRVGAIHLIDSDGALDQRQTTRARPFGEGHIDFRALAPQLLDLPRIKWWSIDLAGCPDAWDLLEPSRDFVLEMLNTKVAA